MNTSRSLRVFCGLFLLLFTAKLANADAIYDFSLPANGEISALSVQLRAPTLLPAGGLLIIPATAPVLTINFPTTGFTPANSVIGFQVTPTATLVGLFLTSANGPLLLNQAFPGDFFSFPRTPLQTGGFASTSGTVMSVRTLATPNPNATLTVTEVPEPASALFLLAGLCAAGRFAMRKKP